MHGGNITAYELKYGRTPLDMSANTSPLPVPEGILSALREAAPRFSEYPDPGCTLLKKGISEKHGVPSEYIACGNGASDIIFRTVAALRPKKALITAPSFSEYERALVHYGCKAVRHELSVENEFDLDDKIIEKIKSDTDLIILCQPNNPTGRIIDKSLLMRIMKKCAETGCRLLMDECFIDFLDEPECCSLISETGNDRLILLRAFTKFYGMAGLRLGYCICSDTALIERIEDAGPCWNVSTAAQAAGIAALGEKEYADKLRALIMTERPKMYRALSDLGLKVIKGEANFILFCSDADLCSGLSEKGILIRDCSDFRGLEKGWYRTAVRTEEDNLKLIRAIREVLRH